MASNDKATVPTHPPADEPKESSLKQADRVSGPDISDAEVHDPPLRSVSPQTPLVGTLTVGAGAHTPPTDPHIGADGRWYADVADARAASVGYLGDDELDARFGKVKS
jgi:hypothetical protein